MSQYYRVYPALLNALNIRHTYEFFHLLNLLFASSILVISYIWLYNIYKNSYLAILAPILILLTPRFIGHVPANPKDPPFAIVYFAGLASIYFSSYLKNRDLEIILLGVIFGLVQSFRIVGISIYAIYILWLLIEKVEKEYLLNIRNWKNNKLLFLKELLYENLSELILIFIVANFIMVLTWPYIAVNYFHNFPQIFLDSKSFNFWDKPYLYMGEYITINSRPWHYLPLLIFITTPFFIIIGFILGMYSFASYSKKDTSLFTKIKLYKTLFLLLTTLLINFFVYLVIKPTIYNGIRHYLFLIPTISFTAALGFIEFYRKNSISNKNETLLSKDLGHTTINKIFRKTYFIIIAACVISVFFTINQMKNLHPYEYIYFNELIGGVRNANNKFEIDYYGASYKEAVEWINNNLEVNARVYTCNNSFAVEYYLRKDLERAL
ncbi:MAG: hypothetical protein KC414_14950, partial [Romboutsia sp.]|nr:hypothetical protein [Romboutsia sp.]